MQGGRPLNSPTVLPHVHQMQVHRADLAHRGSARWSRAAIDAPQAIW